MRLILLALLSLSLFSFSDPVEPSTLSQLFYSASIKKDLRASFHERMEDSELSSPLAKAYFGASKALLAEVAFNPYTKYAYFSQGKELIEEAVSSDPTNLEIRYLRFMIQSNTPEFLDYNSALNEDFQMLSRAIENDSKKLAWMSHLKLFLDANKD